MIVSGSNLTMSGGELLCVEILPNAGIHPTHIHSEARNADRSFVTVNSKFLWSGGKMRGNAEIGAHEGVNIGSGDFLESEQTELMRLEMLCNLVNCKLFRRDKQNIDLLLKVNAFHHVLIIAPPPKYFPQMMFSTGTGAIS